MIPSRHHLPIHEIVVLFQTDLVKGLEMQEAARRLERFGPNVLPKLRRHGPLIQLLLQFHHPLIYVLLTATAFTLLLGEWVDAGGIAVCKIRILLFDLVPYVAHTDCRGENHHRSTMSPRPTATGLLRGERHGSLGYKDLFAQLEYRQ